MAELTRIPWCDHTFNPWRGCAKVSCGCAHCYAENESKRFPLLRGVWGPDGTRVVAAAAGWNAPLRWDCSAKAAGVRRRVFCASLADVFEGWDGPMVDHLGSTLWEAGGAWVAYEEDACEPHESYRPLRMDDVRRRLFETIQATSGLDWLLVTKRPENVAAMASEALGWDVARHGAPPNVWLGASVEDQAAADERVPVLARIPAAVRFLSMEPLLGEVDLGGLLGAVDWVIVGGESGHKARPCDLAWVRSVVRQCRAARVPVFVKQLGACAVDAPNGLAGAALKVHPDASALVSRRLKDPKGGDPTEWEADLWVRQFPAARLVNARGA
jgi:protein gp37